MFVTGMINYLGVVIKVDDIGNYRSKKRGRGGKKEGNTFSVSLLCIL